MKLFLSRLGIPVRVYAAGGVGPYAPGMRTQTTMHTLFVALLLTVATAPAGALQNQPAEPLAPTPAPQAEPAAPADPGQAGPDGKPKRGPVKVEVGDLLHQCEAFPPTRRVGARAHIFREYQAVANTVVLVDSAEAAADAIGSWRGLFRFPVLIDDGSLSAAENIARFVRAFKPERVVRWKPRDAEPWSDDLTARAVRMIESIGRIVDEEDPPKSTRKLIEKFREKKVGPQGVVALDPEDPAWIAGLALAAGRVQPVIFLKGNGKVNRLMDGAEMRGLAESLQHQLDQVGLEWAVLGDEIDMLTIAANLPGRVGLGIDGKDEKALTDLLGRQRGGIGARWAWAGMVFGDAQTSLYRAMCGLFIAPKAAWLFDGYGRGDPWDLYDATSAGRILDEAGYGTEVYDTPQNRADDWRRACNKGISADLVLINSKGNMNFFDLGGKKALCGDIPLLDRPVAVHIVHSWSARLPASPKTVGGRWLEHGAYLYYGSIDEPFLNAFVETPKVVSRLLSGMPFGVAVRRDNSPPWKLNVLGDPLTTFAADTTAGRRFGPEVPLSPIENLDDESRAALKKGEFAPAIRALVMAGRDGDAARLAAALIKQKPESFGVDAARWSVLPLFRAGRYDAIAPVFAQLPVEETKKNLMLLDALWDAARIVLARGPDTRFEGLLRRNLRPGQEEYDAVEAAQYIYDRAGPNEAVHFLEGVSPTLPNERRRKPVLNAIRRFGGPSRP